MSSAKHGITGSWHAEFEHPRNTRAIDALAALDRIEIVHERVEEPHRRMGRQKTREFVVATSFMKALGV